MRKTQKSLILAFPPDTAWSLSDNGRGSSAGRHASSASLFAGFLANGGWRGTLLGHPRLQRRSSRTRRWPPRLTHAPRWECSNWAWSFVRATALARLGNTPALNPVSRPWPLDDEDDLLICLASLRAEQYRHLLMILWLRLSTPGRPWLPHPRWRGFICIGIGFWGTMAGGLHRSEARESIHGGPSDVGVQISRQPLAVDSGVPSTDPCAWIGHWRRLASLRAGRLNDVQSVRR
jgi:hypothetical protein